MSVKALKVISRTQHPNADTLTIYEFGFEGSRPVQIIANSETVYEVGEVAAIALVGSFLKNGTKIKKARIRGVNSFGMALGKTDAEIGTDLSEEFCQEIPKTIEASHVKWPSIELFHYLVQGLRAQESLKEEGFKFPKVTYKAKVKLDGTNGAVQILEDGIAAQSRTRVLSEGNDNLGFHRWVMDTQEYFQEMEPGVILFGEWCGQGLQNRTAISKINQKVFAIFAARIESTWEVRPEKLETLLPEPRHPDVFVLPWTGEDITLDFGDEDSLKAAVESFNKVVASVEKEDPWVKEQFEVSGLGEGVVLYPDPDLILPSFISYEEMIFKAKGEKHQVVKQKKSVQVDPEVAESIEGFVDLFVTENRLQQSVDEACGREFNLRKTGLFMKHILLDVEKESSVELKAAGLSWKQVAKAVSSRAQKWFLERAKAILK